MLPFIIGLPARLPAGEPVTLFAPFILGVPGALPIVLGVFAPESLPLPAPLLGAEESFAAERWAPAAWWTRLHSAPPSERRWRLSASSLLNVFPQPLHTFDEDLDE